MVIVKWQFLKEKERDREVEIERERAEERQRGWEGEREGRGKRWTTGSKEEMDYWGALVGALSAIAMKCRETTKNNKAWVRGRREGERALPLSFSDWPP